MSKDFAYNSLKILYDLDRIKALREGKIVAPKTIRIDLNTVCNHSCHFCLYQSSDDGLKGVGFNTEMPRTQIDVKRLMELIKEFKMCGVNSLVFLGGGEPTIHPSFETIIETANEFNLEYGLITNGSRLDRMLPYRDSTNFKWVRVSLDAANEKTWMKIHRPSGITKFSFSHIIETVKCLKNERPDFLRGLSFIVGIHNFQEVYDFIKMGSDLGVDNVRIGLEYGKGFGMRNSDLIPLAIDQIEKGKKDFESKSFKVFDRVSTRRNDLSNERAYSVCGFKELSTNLGADLNLYTCCFGKYTDSHRIGSLKEMSFAELWFNSRQKFLKSFNISKCPPCWYGETNKVLEYITQKNAYHSSFID